ncbi:MAG: response regulator [Candidatus Saccharimonas sp.]
MIATSKKAILLVDDDEWLVEHTSKYLRDELACRVVTASNGIAAMDAVDTLRPDAIVLDMFMPGPNGVVLLHELQSHKDLAAIPVVVCSNSASDLPLEDVAPYGVVQVIDKATMHPEDVVVALRKVLL